MFVLLDLVLLGFTSILCVLDSANAIILRCIIYYSYFDMK